MEHDQPALLAGPDERHHDAPDHEGRHQDEVRDRDEDAGRPSPQNIPSPPRIRPNPVPGGCTTTTAVTGLGSYPNAVSRAST
jgi:hypothetical protein